MLGTAFARQIRTGADGFFRREIRKSLSKVAFGRFEHHTYKNLFKNCRELWSHFDGAAIRRRVSTYENCMSEEYVLLVTMKIGTVFETNTNLNVQVIYPHRWIHYNFHMYCMQISQSYERIRKTRGGNTATPSRHHGKNHINHARSMLNWYPKLVTQDLANAPIFPCPSARAMEAVWYRNHSSNLLTHLKIDPKTKALGASHEFKFMHLGHPPCGDSRF